MKFSNKIIIFFCLIILFTLSMRPVLAAQFKFSSNNLKTSVGKQIKVDFYLETEDDSINAIEAEIMFDSNYLDLKKIQDANSVVSLWIEKPQLSSPGLISFSGITPGGIIADNALVFSLVFEGKNSGETNIQCNNARALINDGEASLAPLSLAGLNIVINDQEGKEREVDIMLADKTSPESFNIEIAEDKNIFDNQKFIVFATQDKGSGMASYQVKEVKYKFWSFLYSWQEADSPYLLQDQSLSSYIYVKAIDLNANKTISLIAPQNPQPLRILYLVYAIIILIVLVPILWIILRRKKRAIK